jgi:hypothetical protein
VRELKIEYDAFQRGKSALARSDLSTPDMIDEAAHLSYLRTVVAVKERPALLESIHKILPPDDHDRRMGSLLQYLLQRHGRIPQRQKVSNFVSNQMSHFEGRGLARYLEATPAALIAAHTIILIDTGFNVACCDDLAWEPFVGSIERGRLRIATIEAVKLRAGGKIVPGTLLEGESWIEVKPVDPTQISGIQVIKIWKEIAGRMHDDAVSGATSGANKLWLWRERHGARRCLGIQKATADYLWWRAFLKRCRADPIIGKLPIARPMIRSTVIQMRAVRNDFDTGISQALGAHGAAVHWGYISAPWLRAELKRRMRIFQNLLEAQLGKEIEDVALKLGISVAELNERIEVGLETGLGFICLDAYRGVQPRTKPGELCTRLDACPRCHLRRFAPTERGLIALHTHRRALSQSCDEFMSRNPRRWLHVWLPWHALIEATIRVLAKSPYQRKSVRAADEASMMLAGGKISLPTIW